MEKSWYHVSASLPCSQATAQLSFMWGRTLKWDKHNLNVLVVQVFSWACLACSLAWISLQRNFLHRCEVKYRNHPGGNVATLFFSLCSLVHAHTYTHISTVYVHTYSCICVCTCTLTLKQDPDAPTRQNKHLSELDAKDEQSLMKHLFVCIRAGQLSRVSPH